jgi:hypothetical protein
VKPNKRQINVCRGGGAPPRGRPQGAALHSKGDSRGRRPTPRATARVPAPQQGRQQGAAPHPEGDRKVRRSTARATAGGGTPPRGRPQGAALHSKGDSRWRHPTPRATARVPAPPNTTPALTRLCWRMKQIGETGVFETKSPDDTSSI